MVAFLGGKPTKNSQKSRPNRRDDLFFGDQQRTRRKLDLPKNFSPLERNFAPSRKCSSFGTVSVTGSLN